MLSLFQCPINLLFCFVFKCSRSLQHISRVRHDGCPQLVEISTFMSGGNFKVENVGRDQCMLCHFVLILINFVSDEIKRVEVLHIFGFVYFIPSSSPMGRV